MSKKYETPYGKKSGLLLALSMDAQCREDVAVELITEMSKMLKQYAIIDDSFTLLNKSAEVYELTTKGEVWLERRKISVKNTEEDFSNTI